MFAEEAQTECSAREKLLDAAERLFVQKGYEGVTVRDLTEAAGVNVAAINYHFKGKRNLYREVFRHMLVPIAKRRLEDLENVISAEDPPNLRRIVRAYVSGFLGEMLASKDAEHRLSRVLSEMARPGIATDVLIKELVNPINKVLREAMRRARPGLSEEKISFCIASMSGQVIHFVRAREIIKHVTKQQYNKKLIGKIIDHITDFTLRGIG